MSKGKASDILSRMRETTTREKPIRVEETDARRVAALPADARQRVRFTLDLSKEQHKFLKRFALEAETDASAVVRALLLRLEEDETLAKTIEADISN